MTDTVAVSGTTNSGNFFPRTFVVTSGDPSKTVQQVTINNVQELDTFFSSNFPHNSISEIVNAQTRVPLVVCIEVKMKNDITPQLDNILNKVFEEVGVTDERIGKSPNSRMTYQWNSDTKCLKMHIISPCVFDKFAEQFNTLRTRKSKVLMTYEIHTAYFNIVPRGSKFSAPQYEVPYHLHEYEVAIRDVLPQKFFDRIEDEKNTELLDLMTGSSSGAGGLPGGVPIQQHYILANAPKDAQIKFFMQMMGEDWEKIYSDIFIDVAYTECGLGVDKETIAYQLVGKHPRVNGIRRTIRSLRWLLCRHMTSTYNQWMMEQFHNIAIACSKQTITDEAFHQMFALYAEQNFLAIHDGPNPNSMPNLYYFNNVWRKDLGHTRIQAKFDTFITEYLPSHFKPYMIDQKSYQLYEGMIKELRGLTYRTNLRDTFINATAKLLIEDIMLDTNPRILGCENVVIELTDTHAFARPGRPDDFVSLSTKIHYRKYTIEESQELHDWMNKMFVDDDLKSFMYRSFSSLLYGGCPEKALQIWFGSANNGKSRLLDGIEKALGDYFGRFSISSMNENQDASAASPELDQLVGKRAAVCSEIQPGTKVETNTLKGITGGDAKNVRGLYKNPRKLDPMFHVIIACNFVPIFKGLDKAMRNRIVLVPFDSVFDDEAPDDIEEQKAKKHFKADKQFKEKLSKLAPILFFHMVEGYREYIDKGLSNLPASIVALCTSYWSESNFYNRFIDDVMIFSAEASCKFDEVYARFCLWLSHRNLEHVSRPVAQGLLENEMMTNKTHHVVIRPGKWEGCRLRS